MRSTKKSLLAAMLASSMCATSACEMPNAARAIAVPSAPFDGTFSVLTYNIEGVPWPVAWNRPRAFTRIADRLLALRRSGHEPQIVLLQEAFSDEARAIGRNAGYRYVVAGPSADEVSRVAPDAAARQYLAAASWWRGETHGKLLSSGLVVLSDYPVIRVRRMAYPAFACAGFDCLANKGALLVTVQLPGDASPVDIVTTHLNSRHSSHVDDARSLQAYRREVAFLTAFVNRWHDPAHPLIVGGDFNAGTAATRWSVLRRGIGEWRGGSAYRDALSEVVRRSAGRGATLPQDIPAILRRAEDWQFFSSGRTAALDPLAVRVPFGPQAGGMLSDHIGYSAVFRIATRKA